MATKSDSVRINLYVSPKYLEFFDAWADDLHLTRSAAFTVMVRDYMMQSQMVDRVSELNSLADKALAAKALSDMVEAK